MPDRRRVQLAFEVLLEYPLLDVDCAVYTGPEHLPPISSDLKAALRDLQVRWERGEERFMQQLVLGDEADFEFAVVDDSFESDVAAAEHRLRQEFAGTGWSVVPLGARTDEQRKRRRKRRRRR